MEDTEIKVPGSKELWKGLFAGEYTSVHKELDDSYRHGNNVYEVFKRHADDTYWAATYRVSGDGESNDLREGYASIKRCEPYEETVTVTKYRNVD